MNDLPRRPVQPLAAPAGAFDVVTRRARARRTRTGLLAAGLGLAVAATGVVAAMPSATSPNHRIEPAGPTPTTEPEPTLSTAPSPTAVTSATPIDSPSPSTPPADPDVVAAEVFIEAWRDRDAARMRTVAYDDPAYDRDIADTALSYGTPVGPADCTTQRSGQYQCVVSVGEGKPQVYILVGEPDDDQDPRDYTGLVWWIGQVAQ